MLVSFGAMHACVKIDPDTFWKEFFERWCAPDEGPGRVFNLCGHAIAEAEGQDRGTKSRDLVILVYLDAFCGRHGDLFGWQPFRENFIAEWANVGAALL